MKYSKDEILRKYLDSVYMGNNLYGIESALRIYFNGKDPEKLTEDEIIEIITRIHSPNLTGGSEKYAQKISERLSGKIGVISFPEREKKEYTNMFPFFTSRILSEISAYCSGGDSKLERYVREIPRDICTSGSTILHTDLDMDLSLFARDIMESILSPLESKNIHNAAVYIYSEKEKKVLAYIGNRKNTQDNAVDMITRRRSVGSILKPILYKLAFQ